MNQRSLLAAATFAVFSCLAVPSLANDEAPAQKEAAERFDRGLAFFEEGNNGAALAEFEAAEALVRNPAVRLNIGLVYAAMGRSVDAVDVLSSVAAEGSGLTEAQRERARATIAEHAARIGRIKVTTNVVGARLDVDDVRAGTSPAEAFRVSPGTHFVGVSAEGYEPERREVVVASGANVPVHLELKHVSVPAPVYVPTRAPATQTSSQATWGWISIVGGAALATAGGIWLGVNANARSQATEDLASVRDQYEKGEGVCAGIRAGVDVEERCNPAISLANANYADAQGRSDVPAYIGLGVGGAAIGLGIVLVLTAGSRPSTPERAARALVMPDGLRGASFVLRF